MSDAWAALRDGARRVNRAPAVLFGVWALTIVAMLLPAVMGRAIARDAAQADTITDVGGFVDDLSALAAGTPRPASIVAALTAYAIVSLFLAGGIIDRYARDRATRSFGFFGACGVFFFRFLRLAVVQAIAYGVLFGLLRPWLIGRADSTAARLVITGTFGTLVAIASAIFDYTMVRAVVEDRRSMIGALGNALGFIQRHFVSVATLYVVDALLFAGVVAAYQAIAPDAAPGVLGWMALTVGLGFVAIRLWTMLLFWASETALFQMQLAHAGYVARPEPLWPESPAAEAIG